MPVCYGRAVVRACPSGSARQVSRRVVNSVGICIFCFDFKVSIEGDLESMPQIAWSRQAITRNNVKILFDPRIFMRPRVWRGSGDEG